MADDKKAQETPEVIPAPGEETPATEDGAPKPGESALEDQAKEEGNQPADDAKGSSVPEAAKSDSGPKVEEGDSKSDDKEESQDEGEQASSDDGEKEEGEESNTPAMTIYDMNANPSEHGKDFFPADSVEGEQQQEEEDTRTREDDGQVLAGMENDDSGLPIDTGSALIESGLDLGEPADATAQEISDLKLSNEEGDREQAKAISPDPTNANTGPGTGDVTVSTMDNGEEGGKRIQDPEGTGKEQVLLSDTPEHRVANVPMGVEPFSDYMPTPHKVQSNRPADRPEPNRREAKHDFPGNRAQKGREENKAKKDKE